MPSERLSESVISTSLAACELHPELCLRPDSFLKTEGPRNGGAGLYGRADGRSPASRTSPVRATADLSVEMKANSLPQPPISGLFLRCFSVGNLSYVEVLMGSRRACESPGDPAAPRPFGAGMLECGLCWPCHTCSGLIFQSKHYPYGANRCQSLRLPSVLKFTRLLTGCAREGRRRASAPASQCLPLLAALSLGLSLAVQPGRNRGGGRGRVGRRRCGNSEGHDSILVSSSGKRPTAT